MRSVRRRVSLSECTKTFLFVVGAEWLQNERMNMRRIGYLRVSTNEQKPDRQIDGLRPICDELHIETLSAVARARPIYEFVTARLERGDMLVVWALDRAYRSAKDALNELDALRDRGVDFQIANFNLDTRTPQGRFIYTIMSGAAQYERDVLIERTKQGIAAARAQGKLIGRPPKLTDEQLFDAHCRLSDGTATLATIAAEHGIAPWTLTRAIRRLVQTAANSNDDTPERMRRHETLGNKLACAKRAPEWKAVHPRLLRRLGPTKGR